MNKAISILVFFTLLVLGGCRESKKDILVFSVEKKATLTQIGIQEVLAMPENLLVHGDKIIVHDAGTDWVFKVFAREGFDFLGNFIRRGKGPMEEVAVPHLFRSIGNDAFLFQSISNVKLAYFRHSGNELDLVILDEFGLPLDMYSDTDFFLLDEKICSSTSFYPVEMDFRCFDIHTFDSYEWGEFAVLQRPRTLAPNDIFYLAKYATVHPDGNFLAIVYQNFPTLRIYCARSGQMLHQLHMADGSGNIEYFERNSFVEGFITYYCLIKSTSDYIYALYRGTGMSALDDFASVLHIWQWDGTPVMSLELDRAVFSFDVTPDNRQIIASSVVDVDRLFVAEIPWE